MAGGFLQIAAYGINNLYLTNNPSITYFKTIFRRHTIFSIEPYELNFIEDLNFGKSCSIKILKIGDLLSKMYLKLNISGINLNDGSKAAWTQKLGFAIIKNIEITIGGLKIEKHNNVWFDIWYQLFKNNKHASGLNKMIGNFDLLTSFDSNNKPSFTLYVPLQFWFNRYYGLALPLIALRYPEIYLNIELDDLENLIIRNHNFNEEKLKEIKITNASFICDYIHLDVEERKKFALENHDYLYDYVQFTEECISLGTDSNCEKKITLPFNFKNPTKEIIWTCINNNFISNKKFLCFTQTNWNDILKKTSKLLIKDSILINHEPHQLEGKWEIFEANCAKYNENGNVFLKNQTEIPLFMNTKSLIYQNQSLLETIKATIILTPEFKLEIIITEYLDSMFLTIPLDEMIDTRIKKRYVRLTQFFNYGMTIDGQDSLIKKASISFNNINRIDYQKSIFFETLQPYIYHSNVPKNGIFIYSFAIYPENIQPSGFANMSAYDKKNLNLVLNKKKAVNPSLKMQSIGSAWKNFNYSIYIYGFSYNVLKIGNGFCKIMY